MKLNSANLINNNLNSSQPEAAYEGGGTFPLKKLGAQKEREDTFQSLNFDFQDFQDFQEKINKNFPTAPLFSLEIVT